ncbi:MAG: class I lanthipeptide [Bacteroidota bacterium]
MKKKKRSLKKLTLNKSVVSKLEGQQAVGGSPVSLLIVCPIDTLVCPIDTLFKCPIDTLLCPTETRFNCPIDSLACPSVKICPPTSLACPSEACPF